MARYPSTNPVLRRDQFMSSALKVTARLIIADFECAHAEIDRVMGMKPSTIWVRGRPPRPGAAPAKWNLWIVKSRNDASASPDDALASLFALLPDVERLSRLPPGASVEVALEVLGLRERPSFSLSSESLRLIASTRATLDVDIYDLSHGQSPAAIPTEASRE